MVQTQQYTISHTGSVLDPDDEGKVATSQNQVSPQRESTVLSFECPRNFDTIDYQGRRDPTRFIPRTMETFDGDGATTTFSLTARIQPVAGETDLEEQDYPAVEAVVVGSGEVAIDSIDYATGEVTLASAPASGTDNVKLYPIITEGTMKFRGIDSLGHNAGPVDKWGFPLYRFHDFHQDERGQQLRLHGSVSWERHEVVELMMDSPRQLVWTDADYPGAFVSTFEQDVEITY